MVQKHVSFCLSLSFHFSFHIEYSILLKTVWYCFQHSILTHSDNFPVIIVISSLILIALLTPILPQLWTLDLVSVVLCIWLDFLISYKQVQSLHAVASPLTYFPCFSNYKSISRLNFSKWLHNISLCRYNIVYTVVCSQTWIVSKFWLYG